MPIETFASNASGRRTDPDLLDELRARARIRLKTLRGGDSTVLAYAQWIGRRRRWRLPQAWRLHHALNLVAAEIGFQDWEHARRVLGERAGHNEDMGGFWYDCRCQVLLNHWFARHEQAQACIATAADRWLFPFGKQFVVGDANFVRALGLDPECELVRGSCRDVHSIYATASWKSLCALRLSATRAAPAPTRHF